MVCVSGSQGQQSWGFQPQGLSGVWCEGCSVISSCIELDFIIIIIIYYHYFLFHSPGYNTSVNPFVAACKPLCSNPAHHHHQDRSTAPNPAQTELTFQCSALLCTILKQTHLNKQDGGMIVQVHLRTALEPAQNIWHQALLHLTLL